MKIRKHKFLLFVFLMVFCSINTKAGGKDSIIDIKVFPEDTLVSFVKKLGKDSLVKLIDNKINQGLIFLKNKHENFTDPRQTMEMLLLSKHFNWGLDTLKYTYFPQYDTLFQLYERKGGNIQSFQKKLDSLKKANVDISQALLNTIDDRAARTCVVLFGDQIPTLETYFENLFNRYNNPGKSSDGIIELYWIYTQFAKNYPSLAEIPLQYKAKVFEGMYDNYNIPKKVLDYNVDYSSATYHSPEYMTMTNSYSLLAYGLYGNDITIKENGLDLMYLLSFTHSDGGWQSYFSLGNESDAKTTLYALWALAEFKHNLIGSKNLK